MGEGFHARNPARRSPHRSRRGRCTDLDRCRPALSDYTGRGPTKAHTVLNRDSVTIILRDTLTKGERSLVAAGKESEVLRARHAYQEVMSPELIEVVENVMDRKVIAFLSANHLEPDVAIEFFLLEPEFGVEGNGATASD